jgi:hypothetical protein
MHKVGATLTLLANPIGAERRNDHKDVIRFQQLLTLAGHLQPGLASGTWSARTFDAWKSFRAKALGGAPPGDATPYIDPGDPAHRALLLELCRAANVVLPLAKGVTGGAAVHRFFKAAQHHRVTYGWSASGSKPERLAFGLAISPHHSAPDFVIFTNLNHQFDVFGGDPITMNCTSFTNLALSIALTGRAHAHPYDASMDAGGFDPVALRYRWKFVTNKSTRAPTHVVAPPPSAHAALDTYFYDWRDVEDAVKASPHEVYYLAWCHLKAHTTKKGKTLESGFGHHDTILYGGHVYEINEGTPSLRHMTLKERFLKHPNDAVRLMHPG